jgi:hypothetical protein
LLEGSKEADANTFEVVLDQLYDVALASKDLGWVSTLLLHPMHRGLEGKSIGHFELVPNDHTRRIILGFLLREFTHVEIEDGLH